MLTSSETIQYARHITLDKVGEKGQLKLKQAKVLIVGVGGLGCPAGQYLAAAGVGTLGLMDHDVVDASNLQRQVLYGDFDVGQSKVSIAKHRLAAINSNVKVHTYTESLSTENVFKIFPKYDIIIDGTDNFQSKYLINDACILTDKPMVSASVYKFQGQISVFNYHGGPSYRCLFPSYHSLSLDNCEELGVLGVVPGILGTLQAAETIKMILEIGDVLSGKLKVIDILTTEEQVIEFSKDEAQIIKVKEAGIVKLESDICNVKDDHIYLDVRELHEMPRLEGGKVLEIPLRELPERFWEIPKEEALIVCCQSGTRSQKAMAYLREQGFYNLTNLKGGIKKLIHE